MVLQNILHRNEQELLITSLASCSAPVRKFILRQLSSTDFVNSDVTLYGAIKTHVNNEWPSLGMIDDYMTDNDSRHVETLDGYLRTIRQEGADAGIIAATCKQLCIAASKITYDLCTSTALTAPEDNELPSWAHAQQTATPSEATAEPLQAPAPDNGGIMGTILGWTGIPAMIARMRMMATNIMLDAIIGTILCGMITAIMLAGIIPSIGFLAIGLASAYGALGGGLLGAVIGYKTSEPVLPWNRPETPARMASPAAAIQMAPTHLHASSVRRQEGCSVNNWFSL